MERKEEEEGRLGGCSGGHLTFGSSFGGTLGIEFGISNSCRHPGASSCRVIDGEFREVAPDQVDLDRFCELTSNSLMLRF
jgi:hypothetical protein